ncbi:MAG: ABC transporter ATP-binding protein [Flavobacteriaceae bacterium]|nr:ABC transporter ATP-binding protein [Flavobacteriaceae bacterium]
MAILIKNLSKKFKNQIVLDNVNIHFNNRINLLIGENGVGKTTLINLLAGILKMDNGEIFIRDYKLNYNNGEYKNNVGFVLNLPTYPYHFKINEYLDLLVSIYKIDLLKNKTYIESLLVFFDLKKQLNKKINELSTGYIKRVKLFSAMIHNPNCYIFDEPFTSLDQNFIPKLIDKIIDLSKQNKRFLITTHMSQIEKLIENASIYELKNKIIIKKITDYEK